MPSSSIIARIPHWICCFLLYLSSTLLIGGIVGSLLFLSVGSLTHPETPALSRLSHGFVDGFYYAGVWAGGLAIVLTVMRGYREHQSVKSEIDSQAA